MPNALTPPRSPGLYWFTDAIGGPAERIELVLDAGELTARFTDDEGHVDLVPVKDMAGRFEGPVTP